MQPDTGVTFGDVVGVDGAKLELEEIVQFLKESERFTALGAQIPRGLILEVFFALHTLLSLPVVSDQYTLACLLDNMSSDSMSLDMSFY